MRGLLIAQSIVIILLVAVGVTVNHELSDRVDETEAKKLELADELSEWKREYENQLVELDMLIDAQKELNHDDIEHVSLNPTKQSVHYIDWKERKEIVETIVEDSGGKFETSWAYFLVEKAEEFDVDPFIVYELIKIETGATFDPNLVGPDTRYGNARGLGQIMHSNTAAWLVSMAGLEYEGKEQLFDPYFSIELTVVYLDFLYGRYGNWEEALTAYNRGMYGLEQYVERRGHARSSYAVTILEGVNNY